jgi:hypothetical protein
VELDTPVTRSIALSRDGLTLAYTSDAAMGVQRFRLVSRRVVSRRGVPLPVRVRASGFTYSLPAVAYVSADTSARRPSLAQNGADLPASNSTPRLPKTIVQHRTLYAVRPGPPARWPRRTSGLAAPYAQLEPKESAAALPRLLTDICPQAQLLLRGNM